MIDDTTATGDGCAVSARIKHWRQRPSDLLLSVKHPCHFRSRPSPITAQTGNRLGYSSYRHQVIPRTTLRGCACGRCTSSSRIASSVAIRSQPCRSDDGPDPKTDLDSRPGTSPVDQLQPYHFVRHAARRGRHRHYHNLSHTPCHCTDCPYSYADLPSVLSCLIIQLGLLSSPRTFPLHPLCHPLKPSSLLLSGTRTRQSQVPTSRNAAISAEHLCSDWRIRLAGSEEVAGSPCCLCLSLRGCSCLWA